MMNDLCSLAVCLRLLLCCSDVEGQLLSMLHVPRQRSGSVTLSPRPKAPTVDLSLALPLIAEGASAVLDDSFTHCFEVRMLFSASPVFVTFTLVVVVFSHTRLRRGTGMCTCFHSGWPACSSAT